MNARAAPDIRLSSVSFLFLPVVVAAFCFSYALATSVAPRGLAPRAPQTAQPRYLGSTLHFTNPFLQAGSDFGFAGGGGVGNDPQGFDLGDALGDPSAGSITRYISAAGGFLPYSFTLVPLLGAAGNGGTAAAPDLPSLSAVGILSGTLPAGVAGYLRFNVSVVDFAGTQRLGTFRLGIAPAGQTSFRFAHDQLPVADLNSTYFTKIETLGQRGAPVFSVVPDSVWLGTGKAQTRFNRLEEVGLSLAPDGVLLGRPSKKTDIIFTAQALDPATNLYAASRAGMGQSQMFVIKVQGKDTVTSELLAAACSVRGNRVLAGSDSFVYSGFLDTRGYTAPALAGSPLELRIGGAVFRGTFDDKGRVNATSLAVPPGTKNRPQLRLSLSPATGLLSVRLTGANLAATIGLPTASPGQISPPIDRTFQTLVLGLDIGPFRTTEVLKMATRALSGGKFTMDYILARYGFSRAGGCQTYSVGGWDPAPVAAPKGDRWYLRFFVVPGQDIETQAASANFAPPTAPQTLFGVSSITVEIGDFSQQMQMKKGPHWLSFRGTHTANGVYQATFDSRTLHARVQTNIILTDDSNIPAAITTKNLIIFPLAVSFTGFSGETGRIIAPNRYAWKQR